MKVLFTSLLVLISFISSSQQVLVTESKQEEILQYINHFEEHDKLLGSVAISENGVLKINKTFGEKNIVTDAEARTKYTIGSVSKMFTAVMLSQLAQEGKIDFEEKLAAYFPSIPNARKIKIKHLLNHTSGLKDYALKEDGDKGWLELPVTHQQIIDEIILQGVAFKPGKSVEYSNSGYYLLARILEKIEKKTIKEILKERITIPLNLKNTASVDAKSNETNVAKSYLKLGKNWEEVNEFYFPNVSGVGDMISTPADLNAFLYALFTNKIISKTQLKSITPEENESFGLGLMQMPFYKNFSFGHAGDTYATHSLTTYNPKNGLALTYVINGENFSSNNFVIGLFKIIYGYKNTLPIFSTYVVNQDLFNQYQGTYASESMPEDLTIFEENNVLMAQGTGQDSFPLTATAAHKFEFVSIGLQIEFKPEERLLIIQQDGEKTVMELK